MKPNLLIVQPHAAESDTVIDRLCESLCETHYVYLIRPTPALLDDSPAGVRYLNFSLDRLPGFGEVESVILIDSPEIAGRFEEKYPTARLGFWNRETDQGFPLSLSPSLSDHTIIQGEFGNARDRQLARAM